MLNFPSKVLHVQSVTSEGSSPELTVQSFYWGPVMLVCRTCKSDLMDSDSSLLPRLHPHPLKKQVFATNYFVRQIYLIKLVEHSPRCQAPGAFYQAEPKAQRLSPRIRPRASLKIGLSLESGSEQCRPVPPT